MLNLNNTGTKKGSIMK